MSTSAFRVHSHEAPHRLSAGEIVRRLDLLRDEVSGASRSEGGGEPFVLAPADLLRRLACLTSRN